MLDNVFRSISTTLTAISRGEAFRKRLVVAVESQSHRHTVAHGHDFQAPMQHHTKTRAAYRMNESPSDTRSPFRQEEEEEEKMRLRPTRNELMSKT